MSGIAGIISLNKNFSTRERLDFINSIKYRGIDKFRKIVEKDFCLSNSMMFTTKESVDEALPLYDAKSGRYIVSDSRIDNRKELIKKFNLDKKLSDSEIILHIYNLIGKELLDFIVGPFAFVIISDQGKKIFAARDHFGQKPFFYSYKNKSFNFSSCSGSFRHINIKKINKKRIIDYLIFRGSFRNDSFYKDVFKLERGHYLIIEDSKLISEQYHNLLEIKKINMPEEELYHNFRSIFIEVLSDMLRSADNKISVACSGGLDSSSITSAVAKFKDSNIKLNSYSVHFPNLKEKDFKITDEKKYIFDVLKEYNIDHTFIDSSSSPIDFLNNYAERFSFPPKSINSFIHQDIFNEMQKDGNRILLDGFDGDSVISHGHEHIIDLGKNLKLPSFFRELKNGCDSKELKFSYWHSIKNFILKPLMPFFLRLFLSKYTKYKLIEYKKYDELNELTKKQINIAKRIKKFYRNKLYIFKNATHSHAAGLSLPFWEDSLEYIDFMSSINNIELRMPFLDKRVVEFCISVVPSYKFKNGTDRYYFRKSMHGITPESILKKNTKADLSPVAKNELNSLKETMISFLCRNDSEIKKFIDIDKLKILKNKHNLNVYELNNLYAYYVLELWLKNNIKKNIS